MTDQPRLIPLAGPDGEVTELALDPAGVTTIGRSSKAMFRLDHTSVSRLHAQIACNDGLWSITDTDSQHGLEVGGAAVEPGQPVAIRDGDVLTIGPYRFRFVTGCELDTITGLIRSAGAGDEAAMNRLYLAVQEELRAMARGFMANEHDALTLQATALVNEAFAKLGAGDRLGFRSRRELFGTFAEAMRQVLVDAARARHAHKRGGGKRPVALNRDPSADANLPGDACDLSEALPVLREKHPRAAEVLHLRIFGGFSDAVIAELLEISTKTVRRDWDEARRWLREYLRAD